MSNSYPKRLLLFFQLILLLVFSSHAQTGNRVFSAAELANFDIISLSTPTGIKWETDRLSVPGYFSAINTANFSNSSDANNINGYVKKYGNQAFTYPVGTGLDLRTLTISAPTVATDAYATAWILGDPSGNLDPTGPNGGPHDITQFNFPILAVSNIGQWDWQTGIDMGVTGNGVGLTITVSIPDMTAFAVTAKLRLVGWDGARWIDLSGISTASGNTENSTLSGVMQANISAIGIGSTYWVLPVKLNSFTATEKDCGAYLNWVSTNEENMNYFEIEQSNNGNVFNKVGFINAKGNSYENRYAFSVNQAESESYYRLKMVDKNGSFSYSPVQYIKMSCKANIEFINIYPNPVKDGLLFLNLITERIGAAKLILTNAVGENLQTKNITIKKGNNTIKFELGIMPKGIYFVEVLSTDNKLIFKTQKIIVE